MARSGNNNARSQLRSKRPDKKQQRKKQAALVERCIKALNHNANHFREKLAHAEADSTNATATAAQAPSGELKHFEPIRIDTVGREALTDTADLLDKQFTLSEDSTERETS